MCPLASPVQKGPFLGLEGQAGWIISSSSSKPLLGFRHFEIWTFSLWISLLKESSLLKNNFHTFEPPWHIWVILWIIKSCGGPHLEVCPPAFCTAMFPSHLLGIWACDKLTGHCRHVSGDQGIIKSKCCPAVPLKLSSNNSIAFTVCAHKSAQSNIHHSFCQPWISPGLLGSETSWWGAFMQQLANKLTHLWT